MCCCIYMLSYVVLSRIQSSCLPTPRPCKSLFEMWVHVNQGLLPLQQYSQKSQYSSLGQGNPCVSLFRYYGIFICEGTLTLLMLMTPTYPLFKISSCR